MLSFADRILTLLETLRAAGRAIPGLRAPAKPTAGPALAHHNRWPGLVDRLGQTTPARRLWRDRRWRSPQFATAKPQMELRAIHNSSSWPAPCETLPTSHLPSLPGPSLGLPQTHTRARNAVRTAHQTSPGRSAPPPPTRARLGILARRLQTPLQPHPHRPAWPSLA